MPRSKIVFRRGDTTRITSRGWVSNLFREIIVRLADFFCDLLCELDDVSSVIEEFAVVKARKVAI